MNSQLLDSVLLQTDFPELKLHASGKVRDVYLLDQERLLFVPPTASLPSTMCSPPASLTRAGC